MRFRHHDGLRLFVQVADFGSLAEAADALHLTKGAISYQIRTLESGLGFALFERHARGMTLTAKGAQLRAAARRGFDAIEAEIATLRDDRSEVLTIGSTTYFASRWLSPRLMDFMQIHPHVRLRLQPMVDLDNLASEGVDLAIRWGKGDWTDMSVEPLLAYPAYPTGDAAALAAVKRLGEAEAFGELPLLADRTGSTAWTEWFARAGLGDRHRDSQLTVPDPNLRVQAVMDGQGVALNDDLVAAEISLQRLFRLSDVALADYGYFLVHDASAPRKASRAAFMAWIAAQH